MKRHQPEMPEAKIHFHGADRSLGNPDAELASAYGNATHTVTDKTEGDAVSPDL